MNSHPAAGKTENQISQMPVDMSPMLCHRYTVCCRRPQAGCRSRCPANFAGSSFFDILLSACPAADCRVGPVRSCLGDGGPVRHSRATADLSAIAGRRRKPLRENRRSQEPGYRAVLCARFSPPITPPLQYPNVSPVAANPTQSNLFKADQSRSKQ